METTPPRHASRRTILFVDVAGSTELYADLGDAAARDRVSACLEEMSRIVERAGGCVVKSLGDGLLVAFEGEPAAVEAALHMIERAPRHRLRVRIGANAGEVLEEGDDVFGQAVNTAARLSSLARPSELLVTADVLGCLPAPLQRSARRVQGLAIKGLRQPLELYVLDREDPSATLTMTGSYERAELSPPAGLEIRLGTRTWSVGPLSGLRLGRDASNDLIVEGQQVSRRHALIANRRGKYVLADQSVNGTWLAPEDGSCMHLLREEAPLHGSGCIHLGLPPEHPRSLPIRYRTLG